MGSYGDSRASKTFTRNIIVRHTGILSFANKETLNGQLKLIGEGNLANLRADHPDTIFLDEKDAPKPLYRGRKNSGAFQAYLWRVVSETELTPPEELTVVCGHFDPITGVRSLTTTRINCRIQTKGGHMQFSIMGYKWNKHLQILDSRENQDGAGPIKVHVNKKSRHEQAEIVDISDARSVLQTKVSRLYASLPGKG